MCSIDDRQAKCLVMYNEMPCNFQMTFKRPATNRQLTFQEIAAETRLPENEVSLKYRKNAKNSDIRKAAVIPLKIGHYGFTIE